MPPHSKVIYLIKIKGKAKIPDYVQLRDEDFTLIGYFRPGRNEKSVKTLDLTHVHDQIEECIAKIPFGKITKLELQFP
jgi:hypothetical protein